MADASIQTALAVGVPTLAVLVGILINNSRLNDLRGRMDARFADMREMWQSDLRPGGRGHRRPPETPRSPINAVFPTCCHC
jgi:hypothetical protein